MLISLSALVRRSLSLEAEPPAPIPWLMDQVGHKKPDTLLCIYAQVMQRDRAKIGWAFEALMAGASRPDGAANGQTGRQNPPRGFGTGGGEQRESAD